MTRHAWAHQMRGTHHDKTSRFSAKITSNLESLETEVILRFAPLRCQALVHPEVRQCITANDGGAHRGCSRFRPPRSARLPSKCVMDVITPPALSTTMRTRGYELSENANRRFTECISAERSTRRVSSVEGWRRNLRFHLIIVCPESRSASAIEL